MAVVQSALYQIYLQMIDQTQESQDVYCLESLTHLVGASALDEVEYHTLHTTVKLPGPIQTTMIHKS